MKEVISLFILNVLHPFQIQSQLKKMKVESKPQLTLISEEDQVSQTPQRWSLSFIEFLGISWVFAFIHAFYDLVSLNWGIIMSEQLFEGKMSEIFLSSVVRFSRVHSLMTILLEAILFPISFWIYAKFWEMIITFFAQLFRADERPESIKEVINQSFAGHIMLIIPIIGPLVRHIAGLVYIYAGLRENLGMTKLQSAMVVSSPIILFLLMGLIMLLSFVMFFMNLLYL